MFGDDIKLYVDDVVIYNGGSGYIMTGDVIDPVKRYWQDLYL